MKQFSPAPFAAIPYSGNLPNATRYAAYYQKFKSLVDNITITKGKICLIDVHNAEEGISKELAEFTTCVSSI